MLFADENETFDRRRTKDERPTSQVRFCPRTRKARIHSIRASCLGIFDFRIHQNSPSTRPVTNQTNDVQRAVTDTLFNTPEMIRFMVDPPSLWFVQGFALSIWAMS